MRARVGRSFAAAGVTGASPVPVLRTADVVGGGDDQLGRGGLEDVAQRGQYRQGQSFRGAGDQPVHLRGGQVDAALPQRRHQLGGGEHAVGGHHLAQPPPVADLALHRAVLVPSAASTVASSTRRNVRVRKSEDTQV